MPIADNVIECLSRSETYAEAPAAVERIETHISGVFLTNQFAYKLKKPVKFDFLDFSTPELRLAACEEEVRLNRRLAPDVYLGVVPITIDEQGRLELGGAGRAVDWVVKMRRLPAGRSLDRLLAAGLVSPPDEQRLVDTLAQFYRSLAPLALEPIAYRRQLEQHVRANRRELLRFTEQIPLDEVLRVHAAQLQFLLFQPERFDERVTAGRIVEGHGDLRPEHVYLAPSPTIIDCIEFNAEYRRLDLLDELSFFAMECDRLGAGEFGANVLSRCAAALGDHPEPDLLAFYKSYRAAVRAKVAALRGSQQGAAARDTAFAEANAYLAVARREAGPVERPLVVLVRGPSGVGKSTIAGGLAELLSAKWLSTDQIRKQQLGSPVSGSPVSGSPVSGSLPTQDLYRLESRNAVYDELFRQADESLSGRLSFVLDGTFLETRHCRRAADLATRHSAPFLLVDCHCSEELARQRIANRLATGNSLSDAYPELHAQQQREQEPTPADVACLQLDTSERLDKLLDQIVSRLVCASRTK